MSTFETLAIFIAKFLIDNGDIIIVVIGFFAVATIPTLRRLAVTSVHTFSDLFLLRDPRTRPSGDDVYSRLHAIESQFQQFQAELRANEDIDNRINDSLDTHIVDLVTAKLQDDATVGQIILNRVDSKIADAVYSVLSTSDVSTVASGQIVATNQYLHDHSTRELREVLENEGRSVSMLRTVMINLFVVFNVLLLVGYISLGESLTATLAYTVSATYLSLAAFIIYVVRTSHYRSGMLLAIRENIRNQSIVGQFLYTRDKQLTETDADVARLLMTNRAERERHAEHPYELILKGVSGTNIQFRGGKMQIGGTPNTK